MYEHVLNTRGMHSYYDCVSVFSKYICISKSGCVHIGMNDVHVCVRVSMLIGIHALVYVYVYVYHNVRIRIHSLINVRVHIWVLMYRSTLCICECVKMLMWSHLGVCVCIHLGAHLWVSCLFIVSLSVMSSLAVHGHVEVCLYVYLCL